MAETQQSENIWVEPKLAIDVGRGLVAIFLAFSTISLAIKGNIDLKYQPYSLLSSAFNLILAARTFDWMLDRINIHSWAKLLGIEDLDNFKAEYNKWDGASFRIGLFGGSYFFFIMSISVVASLSIWFSFGLFQELHIFKNQSWPYIKFIISLVSFLYIPYQMLTIRSKGSLPFFVGVLVSIISVVVYNAIAN